MKVAIILAILSVALAYEDGEDVLWKLVDRLKDAKDDCKKWTFTPIKRTSVNGLVNITIRDMKMEGVERMNITKIIATGNKEVIDYDVYMALPPIRVSGKVDYKIQKEKYKDITEGTFNFVAFPKEDFDYYMKVMVETYWNVTQVTECEQTQYKREIMNPIVDCKDGLADACNRVHWEMVYANWFPFSSDVDYKICDILTKRS